MYSGSGIGGCLFPFIIAGLLDRFGYKTTMLSLGIAYGVIGGASLIPIRRRIPLSKGTRTARDHRGWRRFKSQWAFAASWSMFLGCMIIVLIGLGNFIPSVWIPCELCTLLPLFLLGSEKSQLVTVTDNSLRG